MTLIIKPPNPPANSNPSSILTPQNTSPSLHFLPSPSSPLTPPYHPLTPSAKHVPVTPKEILSSSITRSVTKNAAHPPNSVFFFTRNSPEPFFPFPPLSSFIAGALAGTASRTVVSPLERLKILLQLQGRNEYKGLIPSLAKMWREEGFKGYMRGNGVNVLRIAPYSAVQFSSYELFKNLLVSNGQEIDTPRRLFAGSLAGICSVVSTYPLDLVRSRLSIITSSIGKGEIVTRKDSTIYGMALKVCREEGGWKALYRGLVPTSLGVAPYVACNFAMFEGLKDTLTDIDGNPPSTLEKLIAGGIAGAFSQTITYPLDVLRRRMQVASMSNLDYHYSGAWDCVFKMIKYEGVRGLYKGILPNLIKVFPSMSVSFFVYERATNLIEAHKAASSESSSSSS